MPESGLVGGIELGGTKTVLAIGRAGGQIVSQQTIPTGDPASVVEQACAYFRAAGPVGALGVGAFGPVVIDPANPAHGHLLETNKPGWSGFDLLGALKSGLAVPVNLVTDVGAAALGEAQAGALRDVELGVYLTIGTGIGGAIVCNGRLLPALLHPEMGHIALHRASGDAAASTCQFHADCAEGLAAGPAIMARFGQSLSHYAIGSPEHGLIAGYLGQFCATLVLALSPHRIVIGGGVGQTPGLLGQVHAAMVAQLGGYALAGVDRPGFIAPPALGQQAGITGALLCAAALPQAATSACA